MAKPRWLTRAIAIFGVILFLTDTGSDSYVGIRLIQRCHILYGSSVLSFFYLPGLLSGGVLLIMLGSVILDDYCCECCIDIDDYCCECCNDIFKCACCIF